MSERNVKAAWFHSDDDEWVGEIVLHDFDSAEHVSIGLVEVEGGALTMTTHHVTQQGIATADIKPEDLFDFVKAKHMEAIKEKMS